MERSHVRRLIVLAALAATASISCGRELTGPPGSAGVARGLSFTPVFPAAARATDGTSLVDFTRVRVVFRRSDNSIALDQMIAFPANADSIAVTLNVPVAGNAPESGEPMSLLLAYVNAAGDTVFRGGPEPVTVKASKPGDPAPSPVPIVLTYTGTGANATRVAISPKNTSMTFGAAGAQFTTQAFDGQNTVIPNTPVKFTSSDTSLVTVSATGAAVAKNKRGSAFVIAELYTGPTDTATVNVLLPAAAIGPISGNNQTGVAGAPLAQNVVVRVLASDSVPVANVPVTFAANSGGSPALAVVNTDASGFASRSWTLGSGVGSQAMTATATGLVGSPVTFSATSVAGVATQLAVTTQPSNVTAGQAIAPAVVVTVRTAGGITATTFNGNVTIAIASNPGGGTLGGTTTVAAVNGIATFAGLSVDKAGAGYTLLASSGALTAGTSAGFTVAAAAASALAFTQQPVGGTPGTPLTPALVVAARDAFGNATTFAGTVSLVIGANPGATSLTGTTSVSAVGGIATFSNVQVGAVGVGYTLVASAAGLSDATSDPFTIGAQVISWANASGGNWSVAANWNLNRLPTASDAVDISLSGTYTVTMDVNANVSAIQLGSAVSGTQTLSSIGHTVTIAGNVTVAANGSLYLQSTAVIGTGTIVNDGQVTFSSATSALALDNRAVTLATGNSALNGAISTSAGTLLRVAQSDGCCGVATLTVANGFTNLGTIELSNAYPAAFGAQLTVTNGTLVNAAGGQITSIPGQTPGGARTIAAQLDNQGTINISEPLSINRSNAVHASSGAIFANANLTIQQNGGVASFTNTGAITIAAGRTLAINNGIFQQAGGSLGGPGAIALTSVTFNLGIAFGNAVTQLSLLGATINGPGTLTNATGRTLTLSSSVVNAPLVNDGLLISNGNSGIGGALSNSAGATLRVAQIDGCCGTATLTVTSGFTNQGTIELTNAYAAAFGAQLIVSNGTLVNASGATISSLPGQTPGGGRTLAAQLDNQGTVTIDEPLSINRGNSAHVNSGAVDVNANLTVHQSGSPASFANSGTITLGTGRVLTINSGSFTQAGTLGGAGTVAVSSSTVGLTTSFSNAVTLLNVLNSTINGPGTLTNAVGRTLTLFSSTVNAPLVNDGILQSNGSSTINGAFTNPAGATLRVAQFDGCCGTATLTIANGFTNQGAIELTNQYPAAFGAQLNVNSGTLVNAAGATISSLGGQTPGGARGLAAQLDNQGTLSVQEPMTVNRANSAHLNSGTIDVSANLTVVQSGAPASLTNTGTITVSTGRTFTVQNGTFAQSSGTLGGTGALSLISVAFNLGTPFSNAVTQLLITSSTVNGPATLTNAAGRTLTLASSTVNAALVNDGLLQVSGTSNVNGGLTNPAGSTIRVAQLDGCCSVATLNVASGFTNEGLIELSNQYPAAFGSQLNVTSGTLVNAAGATIASVSGLTPGGSRGIAAALDNQGTLTVQEPLTINRANSAHQNSGTIDVSANLSVIQSGTPASFANTGTITVAAGRTLTVQNGTLALTSGTLGGTGSLSLVNLAFNLGASFSNAVTQLLVTGSTVNGPGTLTNAAGRTLTLGATTVNAPLVNDGLLLVTGTANVNGALTNPAGSTIRVAQLDGCCSVATLNVLNGFTNEGLIELSNQYTVAYGAQLNVTNGTLVNAAGATIAAIGGQTPGGPRGIGASLDNQGTLTVQQPLSINRGNSAHQNSGTIDVSADLSVIQSGAPASFANTGAISIAAGRSLNVNGGSFSSSAAATISGGTLSLVNNTAALNGATPAVATFGLSSSNATFAQPLNSSVTSFTIASSTVNGSGPFLNPSGQSVTLVASTLNMSLDNQGTLNVSGASAINGALTTGPASVIQVGQLDGSSSLAHLTVANGFTNNGAIDLTVVVAIAYSSQLTVNNGTLVNAGTISSLGGAAPGGSRTLTAQLDNQGTLIAGVPLTLNGVSADHVNTGTIDLTTANLTIAQSGTSPSFLNQGVMTLGAGRTLAVSSGTFTTDVDATITGGTLAFSSAVVNFNDATPAVAAMSFSSTTANFLSTINTATTPFTLASSTLNGSATLTNPAGQTLTLVASHLAMPVDNQGTIVASASSSITGALTTSAGSLIRIGQVDGASSLAHLTVANGFTNNGAIDLTVSVAIAYSSQLTVTNGTLVNASGGTISAFGGAAPGGSRTVSAQLDNQGTVTVGVPLSLNQPGADHINSGTVDISGGNLTLAQSGATPTFVNQGAMTLGAGRSVIVNGGVFTTQAAATITGGTLSFNSAVANFNGSTPAVAALSLSSSTANLAGALNTATTPVTLASSTLNGSSTLTNPAGQTLTLVASSIAMPVDNQGTIIATGNSSIGGALTTSAGSIIRVAQVDGSSSLASLTVANGFSNNGTIELSVIVAIAYNAQLVVTTGTLLNAAGGTIVTTNGAAAGGTRTIVANVVNQGTITVGPGTAGRLNINGTLNTSGTIDLELGGTVANTGYDVLAVSGAATLGGTLNVSLINAFTPAPAAAFQVMTFASSTGAFATYNRPAGFVATPIIAGTSVTVANQ